MEVKASPSSLYIDYMYQQRKSRDLPKKVYLTEEAHEQLRKLKRKGKGSMASIVIELINTEFNNQNVSL